ncbi:MAG: hypothetical protein NTX05_05580 [Fusobacteria bacterium]|nr:hypothetical protein [Fusobacteriota bacterium]
MGVKTVAIMEHHLTIEQQEKKEIREWSFLFLGSAIGSGIILLPLQAGKVSLLTTLISLVIGLVGTYFGQNLMIRMTSTTPNCKSYDHAIETHLGKVIGIGLSVIFIIFLFTLIVLLGTGVTTNFAAALEHYHIVNTNLERYPLYIMLILAIMALPLIFGEKFLLALIEKVVAFKVIILIVLIFIFIPLWHPDNIRYYLSLSATGVGIGKGILVLLPVLIFGATFFPSIGSMGRFFKSNYPLDSDEETFKKANKTNINAMILLAIVLVVFITSTLFALTPSSLDFAAKNNLTALSVIGQSDSTGYIATFAIFAGYLITILALLTSFYAVIIGVIDGVMTRLPKKIRIKKLGVVLIVFVLLFLWIVLNLNILSFIIHVVAPLIVIFVFFIPVIAAYVSPRLKSYRGIIPLISLVIGIFLMIASFIS